MARSGLSSPPTAVGIPEQIPRVGTRGSFVDYTRVGFVDGNNEQPEAFVTHTVDLSGAVCAGR
jgi:hypothetical protein